MGNTTRVMVFKLQRSIATTEDFEQALIYNEDRSIMGQMTLEDDVKKLFPEEPIEGIGFPHKIFVKGTIDPKGVIDITEVTDYQDW